MSSQKRDANMRTLYLAAGCFWGCQAFFDQMKGVVKTQVGYANGNTVNPKYEDLKHGQATHAETVKIEYDENLISLDKILDYYLFIIDPYSVNHQGEDYGIQYRTGVFYEDDNYGNEIKSHLKKREDELNKGPFAILIEPLENFYPAEEYHQDYLKKNPHGYCHVNLNSIKKEDKKQ